MSFEINEYLNWYIPRMRKSRNTINLHASGAAPFDFDGIEPYKTGQPWERFSILESKLAAWIGIPKEELCIDQGATGGTFLFLLTLQKKDGEEILVESPFYEPMKQQAARLGKLLRFKCKMEDDWQLPLNHIESLVGNHTGAVLITEPLNPSGTCRNREDILALADMVGRFGSLLLVNEVYRGYTDMPSFHGERDNIIAVSSFSKLLGFYGLRLGWLQGPPQLIAKLKSAHMNLSMSPYSLASIGLAVFDKIDLLRENTIRTAKAGISAVDSWVRSNKELRWKKPDGPGFGCVALPKRFNNDIAFADKLLEKQNVLVIPGSFFEVPGSIRISWLQSGDLLEEGLNRISSELSL